MNSRLKNVILLFLIAPFLVACWETGNGQKIGTITRLNKRGVFCQTWEGEIIRGGLNTGSGVMGTAFHFTIEDQNLVPLVERAMNTQQEVKITFRSEGVTFCRSDSESYFLTKIEPLGDVATPPTHVESAPPPTQAGLSVTGDHVVVIQLLRQNNALLERLLSKWPLPRRDEGNPFVSCGGAVFFARAQFFDPEYLCLYNSSHASR